MKSYEDQISFLLGEICREHRNLAEIGLSEIGLHAGQERLLCQLWEQDGLTQTQLAESVCLEPPTITKMVSRMENVGIINRRPDPEDARVTRVYLTDSSRELESRVTEVFANLEQRLTYNLTEMEQTLLRRLLLQVRENLGHEQKP